MILPPTGVYIDIHTHHARPAEGIFTVENVMAQEGLDPADICADAFTAGIHPWHLDDNSRDQFLEYIRKVASDPRMIAVGEAGFDKLRGPSMELQKSTFEEQVKIAVEMHKPLIIHCVRAWDELLAAHKKLRPSTQWMVHGFRGSRELASQLLARGMYISFWFDFVLRPESAELLRFVPKERIFLETDGADVDIRDIYRKVSDDLALDVDDLKNIILNNYLCLTG
jgi:TatD DNase family protein